MSCAAQPPQSQPAPSQQPSLQHSQSQQGSVISLIASSGEGFRLRSKATRSVPGGQGPAGSASSLRAAVSGNLTLEPWNVW